jgi:hypothetical protein
MGRRGGAVGRPRIWRTFNYFASRLVFFLTAWTATDREAERPAPIPVPASAIIRPDMAAACSCAPTGWSPFTWPG